MSTTSLLVALLVTLGGVPAHAQSVGVERVPVVGAGIERAAASPGAAASIPVSDEREIVRRWGIRIESLRITAAGYMLDFRYRVVDARKARPLFERRTKPRLIDEETGTVMMVPTPPKTGALRNSNDPKAGRSYFMFFANPGRLIAEGRTVTVAIGDFCVSGLRVGLEEAS